MEIKINLKDDLQNAEKMKKVVENDVKTLILKTVLWNMKKYGRKQKEEEMHERQKNHAEKCGN